MTKSTYDQTVAQAHAPTERQAARQRPFNALRVPRSAHLNNAAERIVELLLGIEQSITPRRRKRRAEDHATFALTATAVLCDLAYFEATGDTLDGIYVSRSNDELGRKDRYRPRAMNKQLPHVLDLMQHAGLLNVELGHRRIPGQYRRTVIRPGQRVKALVADGTLGLEDIGTAPEPELIHLKSAKGEDFWDVAERMDYRDCPDTHAMRGEMQAINDFLAGAAIDFDPTRSTAAVVDTADRALRRQFTRGSFESGGRLWGGFWQNLKKEERLSGITIDQEAIIDVDFGQFSTRAAYGQAGVVPHFADAYDIPTLRGHRDGIKKMINAMLFSTAPLERLPKHTRQYFLRPRYSCLEITKAIENFHSPIQHLFYCGFGHRGQRLESDIMVQVLLELASRGITALPIHDAVLVARSRSVEAAEVMDGTFRSMTGGVAVVR